MRYIPIIVLFMLSAPLNTSGQTNIITQFANLVLTNHNIGYNYLSQSTLSGGLSSSMTYETADKNDKNAAFIFNCTIPSTALPVGFKGYPSGTIGGFKANGTYYPGVRSACGMPVQIKDLNNDLRIKWRVSQQNATDADDKWWASINVIFDNGTATSEPATDDRDYDLVIELNRYENEVLTDEPISNNDYWKFARTDKNNSSSPLKTFDLNYGGQIYKWAVRYKFFNYPATDPKAAKNNKVHVKFIAMYAGNAVAPYLDHPLKAFVDATKDYLQYVSLSPDEQTKVNAEVALPNTWVKSVSAGYEVYTGAFTVKNDVFKITIDNTAPTAPTGLSSVKNSNNVFLNWSDITTDSIEHYKIYRSTNSGAFQLLDSSYISQYTDNTVNNSTNYSYYVKAIDRSFNVSNQSTTASIISIIPVKLQSFKGKYIPTSGGLRGATEGGNLLTWQTSSEINNKQFEIERSTDAKTWQSIGIVAGQGTSNTPKVYVFTDEKPQTGINYYRLRQMDFDGKFELSTILSVHFASKTHPSVFPNPFTKSVVINGVNENETIHILDVLGRQVANFKAQGNSMELDLAHLPANTIYFIKTESGIFKVLKGF
jgi:hypothetical protein